MNPFDVLSRPAEQPAIRFPEILPPVPGFSAQEQPSSLGALVDSFRGKKDESKPDESTSSANGNDAKAGNAPVQASGDAKAGYGR